MDRGFLVLVVALSACSGTGTARVGLGARAGTAASTLAAARGQQAQPLDLNNGVVVTRLRVALSEVALVTAASGSDGELKAAPVLLDLLQPDLESGTSREVALAEVPAETYRELKFKIHKPALTDPGVSVDNGLFWMASDDASVIVDGTVDGEPFTFTSGVDAEETLEGSFDLGDGDHYVTLNLDPTGWFGGANDARLDPTIDSNRPRIEDNIRGSFKAFKDEDHDGREDRD
jgi:hypothetical protein